MHFDYPDQSESQKRIQASVDGILPVLKKSSKKTAKRTIAKKYTVWCQNENGEVYSEIMSGDSAGDAKKRAENKGKNVIDVEEYSAPLAAGKKAQAASVEDWEQFIDATLEFMEDMGDLEDYPRQINDNAIMTQIAQSLANDYPNAKITEWGEVESDDVNEADLKDYIYDQWTGLKKRVT